MPGRKAPLGKKVRRACEAMRKHLLARKHVTEDQIEAVWPKGRADNWAWVECYGSLRAWVWEQSQGMGMRGDAEEKMLAALREEPTQVTLIDGTVVGVHPKGLDALLWLRARSWLCEWLAARTEALREAVSNGEIERADIAEPVTMLERLESELAYQLGAIASVVTHPGPSGGPYQEQGSEIPERWRDANPLDLYRVHGGFLEVNAARLDALSRIVRPTKSGNDQKMSWSVFIGTLAMRLDENPATLARDRSLVSLLATTRLAREAEPEIES